jgi:hypothetical protein
MPLVERCSMQRLHDARMLQRYLLAPLQVMLLRFSVVSTKPEAALDRAKA